MNRIFTLLPLCFLSLLAIAQPQQFFNPDYEPFYHGVASGDPLPTQVIIWSRVTTDQPSVEVEWFVAEDTTFTNIIASGNLSTDASKDYTVKIDVQNLQPNTTYYYVFKAMGKYSLIGRTKTAPIESVDQLKFVLISCSNFNWGYFNVYDRIADRNDLDAVIHVGDYIYEYPEGVYEEASLTDRITFPNDETNTLEEYRARYSLYRLNNELIRAHQQHPFITTWDDHEIANDGYIDGAENHDPSEGDWEDRKAQATQAYFEWLPIRNNQDDQVYRSFQYGPLADLLVLDTRFEGRTVQLGSMLDPAFNDLRTMLGDEQKEWLFNKLDQSEAQWKIIANQVMFSPFNVGFGAAQGAITNADAVFGVESVFLDIWDGYPAERQQIVDHITNNDIDNVVILSGDIHSSFANDVVTNPVLYPLEQFQYLPVPNPTYNPETGAGSAAVEFVTPSVSAANFDENLGDGTAAQFEFITNNPIEVPPGSGNFFNYNPHMKHVDLDQNGYVLVDLQAGQAQGNYYYVPTVLEPSDEEDFGTGVFTNDGDNYLTTSNEASPNKSQQEAPAPNLPPNFNSEGTAKIQFIHAAAFQTVEVKINGQVALPAFAYQTATPYLELPAGELLQVDLTPVGGPTPSSQVTSFQLQLAEGNTYVAAVHGTFDTNDNIPVEIAIHSPALTTSEAPQTLQLSFFHGAADAPGVDIAATDVLFDNVSYGNFADAYITFPASSYAFDVTPEADNQTILASYASTFSFWSNKSAVIFATGFLNDGTFQPWVALSNGGTYPLFPASAAFRNDTNVQTEELIKKYDSGSNALNLLVMDVFPNPTTNISTLKYMLNNESQIKIDLINLEGKIVKALFSGIQQAGPHQLTSDFDELTVGTYFYLIQSNDQMYTQKLVIK